jgi:hypothetical protein
VANQDDNTIVQFVIGNDGKLYPENTVNTPGVFPLALAVNGMNLFVLDTYQLLPTCSTAEPCTGSIAVYPLAAGGPSSSAPCPATVCIESPAVNTAISANYWPLTLPGSKDVIEPTSITVLQSGAYVYVAAYDATANPGANYIFGWHGRCAYAAQQWLSPERHAPGWRTFRSGELHRSFSQRSLYSEHLPLRHRQRSLKQLRLRNGCL